MQKNLDENIVTMDRDIYDKMVKIMLHTHFKEDIKHVTKHVRKFNPEVSKRHQAKVKIREQEHRERVNAVKAMVDEYTNKEVWATEGTHYTGQIYFQVTIRGWTKGKYAVRVNVVEEDLGGTRERQTKIGTMWIKPELPEGFEWYRIEKGAFRGWWTHPGTEVHAKIENEKRINAEWEAKQAARELEHSKRVESMSDVMVER